MKKLKQYLRNVVNRTWNARGHAKTKQEEIVNAVLGLAGEVGEVVDMHKKLWFHTPKPEWRENLVLELGDVHYYLVKLMDLHEITLDEVLEQNERKLRGRYPEGFRNGKTN